MHAPAFRRGRNRARVALVAASALSVMGLAVAAARAADGDESVATSRFEPIGLADLPDGNGATTWLPASMSDKTVSAMLRMSGSPVAVVEADAKAQGKKLSAAQKAAIRADLKSKQDAISQSVEAAGATIVGKTQDAYNGILVHAKQSDLSALAALPRVTGIATVRLHSVPTNTNGVPLIGAPQAWGSNLTGQGVKLAVIDTG